MKKFAVMIVIVFVLFVGVSSALPKQAYLKDGKIVVSDKDKVRILDYEDEDPYKSPYNSKKWQVIEQINPVEEALKVYKKKGTPLYSQKVWIIDRNDKTKKVVVEYTSKDKNSHVVFTPGEDAVFYLNLLPEGTSVVTGLDLLTNKEFVVTEGENFFMSRCPDDKSYIVVRNEAGDQVTRYYIYSTSGEKIDTVDYDGLPDSIDSVICR